MSQGQSFFNPQSSTTTTRRNFRSMQLSGTNQPVRRQPYTHPSRNLYVPHVPTYSRNTSRAASRPTSQPGTPRMIHGNGFATVPTIERMQEQLQMNNTHTTPLQQPNPYTIKLSMPPNISTTYPAVVNTPVMNSVAEAVETRKRAMENRSLDVAAAKQQQARALQMKQQQQQAQREQAQWEQQQAQWEQQQQAQWEQQQQAQREQQQQAQREQQQQVQWEQLEQEQRVGHIENFQRHNKTQQAKMHALAQSEVVGARRARANIPTWEQSGSGSSSATTTRTT